jgi:Ca2+-binding EF-hand superfamily protein
MRKLTLSLAACATALAVGGVAHAQPADAPRQEFTRAAVEQRADRAFDKLDANHDGKLDQADRAAREKVRFDRIDANHDGSVTYAEFTVARAQLDQARKDRSAQESADADRSARHDRRGFAGHRGGFALFADADKDGAITKAEFQASALQRFDRLDANHDGTVTREEAKAARDNMRKQWQSHHEARDS